MQTVSNVEIDELVRQIHIICPQTSCNDQQGNTQLRSKLHEQLIEQIPQVQLEYLDLESIIMKVKTSLAEFQRRIDETVSQQQLRRTTRVRKAIERDPAVVHFFNRSLRGERKVFSQTIVQVDDKPPEFNKNNFSDQVSCSELSGLVQIESLPMSASTNLLTIFVPSILQERLHSCKYKISIDLNRLDLTKKILDLNVEQQVNSNLENELKEAVRAIEEEKTEKEEEESVVVCQRNDVPESCVDTMPAEGAQSTSGVCKNQDIEVKPNDTPPSLEPIVSIVADRKTIKPTVSKRKITTQTASGDPPKKRGRKLGSKNKNKKEQKSEIAKYVEMFAAGSPSSVSQIVTSTTQNWDNLPEQNGQIAYFMNGEWTLNAPTTNGPALVSTTNGNLNFEVATDGVQDNFIPFEDFVNYIENPTLNAENNVIAQVLDGTVDTASNNPNNFMPNLSDSAVTETTSYRGGENTDEKQEKVSGMVKEKTKELCNCINDSNAHSTAGGKNTDINDGPLDLSKENKNLILNVLDLDQKKPTVLKFSSTPEKHNTENGDVKKFVIFSTSRNMPSLDNTDGDLLPPIPQRTVNLEKKVVFSMAPPHSSVLSKTKMVVPEPEENSTNDSAIVINDSLTQTKSNGKSELIKGMSLLEIEKDLNDSMLNFDNFMDDDMLSLTPSSCFNSPNEDRFADSNKMDIEQSTVKYDQNFLNSSAPRSHLEFSFSKLNEEKFNPVLKNFKIPRTKSFNGGLPQEPSPASTSIGKSHDTKNVSNSTDTSTCRVNETSSATKSSSLSNQIKDCSPAKTSILDIPKLFGSICFDFLADNCFQGNCKFRHHPLELNIIIVALRVLNNDELNSAYRFIWRHHKLFKFYFPTFCEEYARRNKRHKLSNMINDCKMQPNSLCHLRNVYTALIATGLNKVNACRYILSRVTERSHPAIDILLELIIESGIDLFTNVIEQFQQIADYKFRMKDINQLATACLRSGSAELVTVLIKCLINVDQAQFLTMRSPELIHLLEMVKNGGIDGL